VTPVLPTTLTAAAGGAGGSWYVLLEGLAALVHELQPEIVVKVVEGGGVENHARVGAGELPMAILNPPMTVAALSGVPPYARAFPDLRVGLTNLTVNHLQLVVDRAIPIASLEDWVARAYPLRIPVDRVGTVDRLVFELALAHIGLSVERLEAWGGRAVPAQNYHDQIALYRSGEADALWQFMGIPSPSIEEAHAIRPVKVLPLPATLIEELSGLGWQAAKIPVGSYSVVDQPISTVAMGTSLGFHVNVPGDVVHVITRAICEHAERVRAVHPAARAFDPARAHLDAGGPLHPGAERYFRDAGFLGNGSA